MDVIAQDLIQVREAKEKLAAKKDLAWWKKKITTAIAGGYRCTEYGPGWPGFSNSWGDDYVRRLQELLGPDFKVVNNSRYDPSTIVSW
ncbi:hypothetical protein A3D68_02485 [Candidatus Adlerbacteria bacterium RIFCSPHIGHO2_02_FULL_52_17]|uniref:Uncharacterized protein n=1 Tax=Candidatus Adlerbacteria bacterium RIFCSPHIGHO2_02_FULL_52_17 TaxID=1797240 RepID=A0A1F4XQ29_9BACT|nr:MAG: hypothetical protein A3D68_02485 [Candidatus Adlerbacteria bacterium RIFCSPHIGHO2_02_FULL_52_17]